MGVASQCPACLVPVSRSGRQEIHVVGANSAALAFAVRLAENMPAGKPATVYVWDEHLQRSGLRKRRLAVLSHEKEAVSQAVSLHNSVLSASLSSETQAALFPEGKEHLWEHTANTTASSVEDALLRRAQSPALAQHIKLKSHNLSKEMLHAIASKPNVIIIIADGDHSAVCNTFAAAHHFDAQQEVACNVELAYDMSEDLKSAMKESAATSVVHTVGQRVFLHNFDCKDGNGTVTIRVTAAELEELVHYKAQASSTTLGVLSKELNKQTSLAAVSLSDLIDSALLLYGIPSTAVRRINGTRNVFCQAPFYAQELHPGSVNGGHVMLIGDAAMKVEFWPGRGMNTAFATAHLAAVSLLSSMTTDPAQPCFALTPGHLQAFSRQMSDLADTHRACCSMDVLPGPSASSRWSAVAAMIAEEIVHDLMEQICDRGATAVEHLWPILPSHALIESRLRQMLPDKVHVLRRMLRDGPLPGQGANMLAPFSLPPFPSRQAQSSPTPLSLSALNAASPRDSYDSYQGASAVRSSTQSQHCTSRLKHSNLAARPSFCEEAQAQPQSVLPTPAQAAQSLTISNVAPARMPPAQQSDLGPVKVRKHVSWESSSEQSSPIQSGSDQSSPSQSASHSTQTSSSSESQTLSEINAKIAVLNKWGQPLPAAPQLPSLSQPKSPSRQNLNSRSRQRLMQQVVPQSEQLSVSVTQADSPLDRQASAQPTADFKPKPTSVLIPTAGKASRQAGGRADVKQRPPDAQSSDASESTRYSKLGLLPSQAPQMVSPQSLGHPQKAQAPSQGPAQRVQQPPVSSKGTPPLTRSSPQLPQGAPEQDSRESLGLSQAEQKPQAQSLLQMWPHVRKYAVPQPLKAPPPPTLPPMSMGDPSTARPPQTPQTPRQTEIQGHAHSTDRQMGLTANTRSSPVSKPSSVLRANADPASSLSQMLTALAVASQLPADNAAQLQTQLPSQTHRHVSAHGALEDKADGTMQPKTQIRAETAAVTHTPEWIKPQGRHVTHEVRAESQMWQTPHLPAQWSGQGNPLFGWWELGSAITGNMDGHPSEADFSPATPKNEEAANLMHSAVPFALVAHR